jgi:hypothetical protein
VHRILEGARGRLARATARRLEVSTVVCAASLEAHKATLVQQLADARPLPRLEPRVITSRLGEWRRLLRGDVMAARMVLDRVLAERIQFSPTDDGEYYFECMTRFDKLFCGAALKLPPSEDMPMWMPSSDDVADDVRDAMQYEAVLQQAYRRIAAENAQNSQPKQGGVPGRI